MMPTLADVESLARGAGEILRQGFIQRPGFERSLEVKHKGEIDLVTEMDRKSEAYLLGEIRRRFPEHGIMAEESGAHAGKNGSMWYVDPLDGTVNYAHGVPLFTVSVAYAEDGVVKLGAVYDPMQDELFSAGLGQGAALNGQPIRVSQEQELDQSLLVTGFPYDIRTNPQNNLDNYVRFALRSQGVRRLGSAALDLAYIAAGRFDGFWEIFLHDWDIAAGGLIVREAGGVATQVDGHPDFLRRPVSILAANAAVHAQMLGVLNAKGAK